ncbi:MAG: YfhO family protein [Roseburia sp.]|nr:YfhO family protein [Roseburia sp.]
MTLRRNGNTDRLCIFSFCIPVAIMLMIFFINDIYPFGDGDRSFLHIDMYHQYFPFLTEFYHKLRNGESLLYSWNTGIGSNFPALYVYYLASPSNWLCVLVPEAFLMEFLSYTVVFKIGLCGASFSYYMKKHFRTGTWMILLFSLFYALSGFMAAYNWNVMWLDVVVLTPVIVLGLERLVREGRCRLYCIALGLSILSNYYLSIMLCIFLALYFVVLLVAKAPDVEDVSAPLAVPGLCRLRSFYLKAAIRFAVYSLLAGGMAAVLLFPEIVALTLTEFSEINFPGTAKTYFSVMDMVARHCFNVAVETGLDHWPNLYCGAAVFLLLPLYAFQGSIPLRQRAPKLILLAFMLISFSTNVLNFIWHGLNYPDSLPARQSFLYIFLLLTLCFESLIHIREHSGAVLTGGFVGALLFLMLCEKLVTDDAFTSGCFLATALLLFLYAGFIHIARLRRGIPRWLFALAAAVVILEAGLNTFLTSVPTVSRTAYLSNYASYQELTDKIAEQENGDFFRFDKFARRTQNDAMLIGFQGCSYFSSTQNASVTDFYETYGMKGSRVNYCFDGATPVTAALLANRYMLYTLDRGYDSLFELADVDGKVYAYRNKYALPLGYMVSEYREPDEMDESLNPIQRQNRLVQRLGVQENVFVPVTVSAYGDIADIVVTESAHYYAYTANTKIDTIKMTYRDGDLLPENAENAAAPDSKSFTQIKKKYILDLGYHTAGEMLSLHAENGQPLNISVYKTEESSLRTFIDLLSQQTMTVDSYDTTHIDGHIQVRSPGRLVLSVAYEPGWTLRVDGKKTDISLFEDTFISVPLTEGTHTIALSYFPKGLILGGIVSVISIALFLLLCVLKGKKSLTE